MRESAPFALLACACGAAVAARAPAAPGPHAELPKPATADAPGPVPTESFDRLSAKGATIAAGMREAARRAGDGSPVELLRADDGDLCVRVAFEASVPVSATLTDDAGDVLATAAGSASEGVLAAAGPVCIRKGDAVRAAADPPSAHVRWMAWEAP